MMRFLVLITIWALASARPETYREKEDFQYSRSSTDEGSKAGFYGAQRGNMGGNYERAHNMDSAAQHQMSSLVRQVDGELGPGADTNTGSVYTAGNSRGVFGSGHYDLSNLKGRNFGEGTSYGDSQSSGYSQSSRYQGHSLSSGNSRQQYQTSMLNQGYQTADQSASLSSGLNQHYDNQADRDFKYYGQSNNQGSSTYDQSVTNSHGSSSSNIKSRLVSATPLKVYVRPGTKVTIPVAAQTYDASNLDSIQSQNSLNSESELLTNSGNGINYKPKNNAKHYESSYSYRKEWEKHDTQPLIVTPTENPFPKNSELYDTNANLELQNSNMNKNTLDMNSIQSSNYNQGYLSEYNTQSKSSSTRGSRYRSGYNSEAQNTATGLQSSDYTIGTQTANLGNSDSVLANINTQPKSYQSSYSYHKSWERQGDPYVIIPTTKDLNALSNEEFSKRLTAASDSYGQQSSNHYGSHHNFGSHVYSQNGNVDCDCDENGHIRVPRSYNTNDYHNSHESQEDLTQQTQGKWENFEDLGQQIEQKFDHTQALDQNLQSEHDLGQQTYNKLDNIETFEKFEDLGQQTENKWNNLELEQQSYNKWNNRDTLDQQTQNHPKQTADLGQETENKWDNLEDLGQHNYNKWDNMETLNQQNQNDPQKLEDLGQQTVKKWDNSEDLGQQSYNKWNNMETLNQQSQDRPQTSVDTAQQTENKSDNFSENNYNKWDNIDTSNQQNENYPQKLEDLGQQTENKWDDSYFSGQQKENNFANSNNLMSTDQETQNHWGKDNELGQQNQNKWDNIDNLGQQTQNNWFFNNKDTQSEIENQEKLNKNNPNSYNQQQEGNNNLANNAELNQDTYDSLQNSHSSDQNQQQSTDQFNFNENKPQDSGYTNFWDQFDFSNNNDMNKSEEKYDTIVSAFQQDTEKTTQRNLLINNIWNKLDKNLGEAQVESSSINNFKYSKNYSYSNEYWSQNHNINSWTPEQNTNFQHIFDFNIPQENHQSVQQNSNQFRPEDKNLNTNINIDHDKPRDSSNHSPHPIDVGRGDIESEDLSGENTNLESLNLIEKEKEASQRHATVPENTTKHNVFLYNHVINNQNTQPLLSNDFHKSNSNENLFESSTMISLKEKMGKEYIEQVKPQRNGEQQATYHNVEHLDQQHQDLDTQSLLDFDQHTQMLEGVQETQQLQQFADSFMYEQKDFQQNQNLDTFPQSSNKEKLQLHPSNNKDIDDHTEKIYTENKNPINNLKPNPNKHDTDDVPVELVTEKPGFWTSVGNKLSNAKESVISWFKRS